MSSEDPSINTRTTKRDRENQGEDREEKQRQEFIKKLKNEDPCDLLRDHPQYRDDEEVIKTAVEYDGRALERASHRLQNSPEIALKAMEGDPFVSIGDDLRDDKLFCQSVLAGGIICSRSLSKFFSQTSQRLRNDKDFMTQAMRINKYYLMHAGQTLRNDKEFVQQAIRIDAGLLTYADIGLRNDKEFIQQCMLIDKKCCKYAGRRLYRDKEFVQQAIRVDADLLQRASRKLRADPDIVKEAVSRLGNTLRHASSVLRGDKQIVMTAIANCDVPWWWGRCPLSVVSDELRDDEDVVEATLLNRGEEIKWVSDRLQNSPKMLAIALENCKIHIGYVQSFIVRNDRCLQLKHHLAKLRATLQGCKFPMELPLTPKDMVDNMLHVLDFKPYLQQALIVHELPIELVDKIFAYSAMTSDEPFVMHEIQELGPFLFAGAKNFHLPSVSW